MTRGAIMAVVEYPDMKVMLERRAAGFTVEVGHIPTTGEWILQGTTENYRAKAPILPEQVMTAFKHPCVFLPYADRFFRDLKEGEVADESALPLGPKGMHKIVDDMASDASDPMDYCAGCSRSLLAHEVGDYCSNCSDDGS